MYYKQGDLVSGIYLSKYNMMFEWNDFENKRGWFVGPFVKKFFTERDTEKFDTNTISRDNSVDILNYYKSKTEKLVLDHSYANQVKVRIDDFEYAYHAYQIIKNYFCNHEGFKIEVEYMPSNYALFTRTEKPKEIPSRNMAGPFSKR